MHLSALLLDAPYERRKWRAQPLLLFRSNPPTEGGREKQNDPDTTYFSPTGKRYRRFVAPCRSQRGLPLLAVHRSPGFSSDVHGVPAQGSAHMQAEAEPELNRFRDICCLVYYKTSSISIVLDHNQAVPGRLQGQHQKGHPRKPDQESWLVNMPRRSFGLGVEAPSLELAPSHLH